MNQDPTILPVKHGVYVLFNLITREVVWSEETPFVILNFSDAFAAPAMRAYAQAAKVKAAYYYGQAMSGLPPDVHNPIPSDVCAYRAKMKQMAEKIVEIAGEADRIADKCYEASNKCKPLVSVSSTGTLVGGYDPQPLNLPHVENT